MLIVRGLNQYYAGSHTLRNISFEMKRGACTALLGRNGVGKSTLLKCLVGVLPIQSGSIAFEDRFITDLKPHERVELGVAYVPQGREIFPRLTVEENLRMGLASKRGKQAKEIPSEVFQIFPALEAMLPRRGGDLSGGQQQQLAIARALVVRPKLLMLDEPTEGIQPSLIKEIEQVIRRLGRRGDMAILLVEQYYDFARGLADQYLIMSRGEIVRRGKGDELAQKSIREYLAL